MPPYNIDLTQEKSDIIDYKGAGGNRNFFFTSLKKIKIYSVYIYQEKYFKKNTQECFQNIFTMLREALNGKFVFVI